MNPGGTAAGAGHLTRRQAVLTPEEAAAVLLPRDGVVAEKLLRAADGVHRFGQAEGPLAGYRRVVTVSADGPPGALVVTQEVTAHLGLAPVAWLFALPLRRRLGRIGPEPSSPWWLPPTRLPRRAAVVLVDLCVLSVLVGYLSDLLAYTMTYAGTELRVGSAGQGLALGLSRLAAVGSLAVLAAADRRGRRPVLVAALTAGAVLTSLGALAPSLTVLTATQIAAGAFSTAAAVLVGVMAAEEMPAGSRAWALGVSGMCFGLGAGGALAALPLAGTGPGGWRWLFAIGLLAAPCAVLAARWLPETTRFVAAGAGGSAAPLSPGRHRRLGRHDRRMLAMLGAGAFLLAVFADPSGGLQNQFLRHERHLSPLGISLLLQVTGTVGGLGTLVGGRLADTRGRRPVAAAGLVAMTGTTLAVFFSRGAGLWVWETVSSLVSYGLSPALEVYGAELFPTGVRGRAGGMLTVVGAAGGLVGLAAAGELSATFGAVGPALAVLAVCPLAVAALVLVAYPETAARTLEDLNPGDRAPAPGT